MFTVKFISQFDDGTKCEHSISCPHYSVYDHGNGCSTVTVYQGFTETGGVDYEIMSDESAVEVKYSGIYYNSCYIENDTGKTINRIV